MTDQELRDRLKARVDALPSERLPLAAEFLRYLRAQDRSGDYTLDETKKIEATLARIEEAQRDIAEGRGTPWREVRSDV